MASLLSRQIFRSGAIYLSNSTKTLFQTPSRTVPCFQSRKYSGKPPPADSYKFLSSHEWARLDGDIATTGISDHAQDELGDVVFVDLPEVGQEVKQGKQYSAIESVKAANDLYAPMSGEVTEVNNTLEDDAAMVNKSPYKEGWIAKIKVSDPSEFDNLLSFESYSKNIEET